MKKETFVKLKEKELDEYCKRLRNTYKRYAKFVRVTSENNRKARVNAAGEAVLRALDALCETAGQVALVKGGLVWRISEEKNKDENGKVIFVYEIGFSALSSVREYTEEQIGKELAETWQKMQMEIDERFPEEKDEKERSKRIHLRDTM